MSEILTPKQVAERLQVSERTVRAMIASGSLESVNVGLAGSRKRYRVTLEQLEKFVKRRATSAEPAKKRGPRVSATEKPAKRFF